MTGPDTKEAIEKLAAERSITVPLTFLPQGPGAEDVGAYKINPEARNTVLLWNRGKIVNNFVNVGRDKWTEVEAAVDAMLK